MRWSIITLWLIAIHAYAQSPTQEEMLDQLADELLTTADGDVSYEELYETLTHLLANPIDVNAVTPEQMRAIQLLSEKEIHAFFSYRESNGPLLDVLELQAIPEWSETTLRHVLPFVRVRDPSSRVDKGLVRRIRGNANSYLVLRYERTLEQKLGYSQRATAAQRYAGNPDKYYFRFRSTRPGDFSIGLTAEKDPGEVIEWNPGVQYAFDFLSGHLQLMNKGRLENLVIGDYQVQFGQGLQLGSVFGLGKTSQTITGVRRSNLGILPYMSAGESYFLRGISATIRLSPVLRVHLLASRKSLDAGTDSVGSEVISLNRSGLHRTIRERATRGTIVDQDLGAALQYRKGQMDVGILVTEKQYSKNLESATTVYNQYSFRGQRYLNAGAWLNATWGNVTFFSEAAQTIGYGRAITVGLLGNLTSQLEMSWLYRSFDRDYYSDYANAVAESSSPQNEQGFYWGARYSFSRKLILGGYADVFRFPWLRYRIYRPSEGSEWLLRIEYAPSKAMAFFAQVREESKSRNSSAEGPVYRVLPGIRRQGWIGGNLALTPAFSLKSRLQGSQYEMDGKTTSGVALIQDVVWKKGRWSIAGRYALFDTQDYDNRQYVYEKDVWMATSLPAYDGTGIRNYILVQFTINGHIDVWARWGRTWYANREVIGSGGDEIAGNVRNDIKFQVRIRP